MRFLSYADGHGEGLAVRSDQGGWVGLDRSAPEFPGWLEEILAKGGDALAEAGRAILANGKPIDPDAVEVLPPLRWPGKILCVGLNYAEHTKEGNREQPEHPTIFVRFPTTFVGHGAPLVRPTVSEQFDYEGELVCVIGKGGRNIAKANALEHVAGWSIFNDATIRNYQRRTPQWTMGKNFDGSGGFGPVFVTADELPPAGKGLHLETRLNGQIVQSATTADMIFDVPTLIADIAEVMTLHPGDMIVTGTPSGVGFARTPPLWLKAGDVVEVEIEGLGVLRNPVIDA